MEISAKLVKAENILVFDLSHTVFHMIEKMKNANVSGCFMVDETNKYIGYLHQRNLLLSGHCIEDILKLTGKDIKEYLAPCKVVHENDSIEYIMGQLARSLEGLLVVLNEKDYPVGIITARDILFKALKIPGYQKQSQEELRDMSEQLLQISNSTRTVGQQFQAYKELMDNSPDMIHSVDENRKIIEVNRVELDTLGYEREELIGKNVEEIYAPEVLGDMIKGFQNLQDKGELLEIESKVITKSGEIIPVEVNSTVNRDEKGNFICTHTILRNISERKKAQKLIDNYIFELRQSNLELGKEVDELAESKDKLSKDYEVLEATDKLKNELIAMVSHDLKSPLTKVMGYSSIALEAFENFSEDDLLKFFKGIHKQSSLALELCTNLLDSYKIEHGALKLNLESYELAKIINKCTEDLNFLAGEKDIPIKIDNHQPELRVVMDPSRIEQVLKNLLTNAVKYGNDNSPVEVEVKVKENVESLEKIVSVSVTNEGKGMTEVEINELFKKVEQMKRKNLKGTGIGLSIAKKIVDLHGGEFFVESVPDQKTTFSFTIPLITAKS